MRTDHDSWNITTSVGATALGVAAGRALAGEQADALVRDPYARDFVTAAGLAVDSTGLWHQMAGYMGVRTRFFDEYLATATNCEQAVILASGLDSRPYRLAMPPRTFELDRAEVLDFKREVLDARGARALGRHAAVSVDLRDEWTEPLRAAGFDPTRPAAWLAEGLLPYLPADAREALFARIDALSAPGSRVAVEDFTAPSDVLAADPELAEQARAMLGVDIVELFYPEPSTAPATWFADHGWTVQDISADDRAREYHRPLDGMGMFAGRTRFVTAVKS